MGRLFAAARPPARPRVRLPVALARRAVRRADGARRLWRGAAGSGAALTAARQWQLVHFVDGPARVEFLQDEQKVRAVCSHLESACAAGDQSQPAAAAARVPRDRQAAQAYCPGQGRAGRPAHRRPEAQPLDARAQHAGQRRLRIRGPSHAAFANRADAVFQMWQSAAGRGGWPVADGSVGTSLSPPCRPRPKKPSATRPWSTGRTSCSTTCCRARKGWRTLRTWGAGVETAKPRAGVARVAATAAAAARVKMTVVGAGAAARVATVSGGSDSESDGNGAAARRTARTGEGTDESGGSSDSDDGADDGGGLPSRHIVAKTVGPRRVPVLFSPRPKKRPPSRQIQKPGPRVCVPRQHGQLHRVQGTAVRQGGVSQGRVCWVQHPHCQAHEAHQGRKGTTTAQAGPLRRAETNVHVDQHEPYGRNFFFRNHGRNHRVRLYGHVGVLLKKESPLHHHKGFVKTRCGRNSFRGTMVGTIGSTTIHYHHHLLLARCVLLRELP
eukprot:m.471898 g.471898  ORF g.471898 m.471898 type:complete len:498 (+) comp20379_c1_seq4:421-1914(+)